MIIENIERKIRLALILSALSIISGIVVSVIGIYTGYSIALDAQNRIYVMSNDIPLVATTSPLPHLEIEGKAIVKTFHNRFFTLPPDDEHMSKNISDALYLIDESGVRQRNALTDKGFYSHILSQSANFSIICDSINIDPETYVFEYYGTQRIEGRSHITFRRLVTSGRLTPIPRSSNNPYGYLIVDYKTISNQDIETTNNRL